MARRGRKSKWSLIEAAMKDGRIQEWLANGVLERDIAKNLGVSVTTWEKYKAEKKEFREFIKEGIQPAIAIVENSLFEMAQGRYVTETMTTTIENPDGSISVRTEEKRKYIPGNCSAAIFYLKNKDREHWKNDPELSRQRDEELKLRKQIAEGRGDLWDA